MWLDSFFRLGFITGLKFNQGTQPDDEPTEPLETLTGAESLIVSSEPPAKGRQGTKNLKTNHR